MNLYIDCEWSESGQLISMALVDEKHWSVFYEVLECLNPGEWQAVHVMPILNKAPLSVKRFKQTLGVFLAQYTDIHIVADWPQDIAHFCQALITGPGFRLDTPPLTMEVRRIDSVSELPHNALADAEGLRRACLWPVDATAPADGGE